MKLISGCYMSVSENDNCANSEEPTSAEQVFCRMPGQRQKLPTRGAGRAEHRTQDTGSRLRHCSFFKAEDGNAELTSSGLLQVLHVSGLKRCTKKHQVVNLGDIFSALVVTQEKLDVLYILELDEHKRNHFLAIQLLARQNYVLNTSHCLRA